MKKYYSTERVKAKIERILRNLGKEPGNATQTQYYAATCLSVRDILAKLWTQQHKSSDSHKNKQVYYFSMEFLPGSSLRSHIFNLGIEESFREATMSHGHRLDALY